MASASPPVRAYASEGLKGIVNILQDISDDLPIPASAIINLVKRTITAVETLQSSRDECGLLQNQLLELLPVVMMIMRKHSTRQNGRLEIPLDLKEDVERLRRNLEAIEKEVSKISAVVNSKRKRHKLAAAFWANTHATTLQKCRGDLDWAMKLFDVSSRLNEAMRLWEVSRKVDNILTNEYLESLPRAKYASFDYERPDKPSGCFQGTRTAIIKLITDWITGTDPTAPRFFWLNGIAGIGKTTVACTIAGHMQNLGLLGGHFCFSRRGEAQLRNPALVLPTIAYQLARFDPEFGRRITAALEADPEAPYASFKQQLDRLIINPLKDLDRDPERVVLIMFDAFDECEARGAKEILQLLVAALPSLPFFLKIFITSRPELHIRSVLIPATGVRMTALHDIETSVDSDTELLAERAGSLFIHAATSARFVSKGINARRQLATLLDILGPNAHTTDAAQPFTELDRLYQQILLNLIPEENSREVAAQLRLVLGSIVLLRDPVPVDALERLINAVTDDVASTLLNLHSVILSPPPPDNCPRPYHPSFPDFLQDHNRCTDSRLWIATGEHEERMALRCLMLLNARLQKGMLGDLDPNLLNSEMADFAAKVHAALPSELQYACRYWVSHLGAARVLNAELNGALTTFVSRTMLPWMEAMSWLGDIQLAITCLRTVNSWMAALPIDASTKALFNDGHRLLLSHRPIVALGAQHLARSVLPFAPSGVALTSCYRSYTDTTVRVIQGVDSTWSALLMVWVGHLNEVWAVAFSPDGSRVASGSMDRTIRLWDPMTGVCTITLQGHSDSVTSVTFSPDGTHLASGSTDRSVRVWDAITGICMAVLEGHLSPVYSVAFSPDGTTLASGTEDRILRLWDTTLRACVATFSGHSDAVLSVAFSANGTRLASGSRDTTIRIWDSAAGTCTATLRGHSSYVRSVVVSPDGSRLASGSDDGTVRTWDTETYSHAHAYQGHSGGVNSLAFSSDGSRLASGSDDEVVLIWGTATGQRITTLRGHSNQVWRLAFSPDDSLLVSGSADGTVRLWDATVRDATDNRAGHSDYVVSVAFSRDGTRLASGSYDCTARVWDTADGRCIVTLLHPNSVETVAFSPDGVRLATGSNDGTVRLWDATTGACTTTWNPTAGVIDSLIFSSNGSLLRFNGALTLNASTGKQVEEIDDTQFENPIERHFKIVDGRLFRTSEDGSARLICSLPSWAPAYNDLCRSFKLRGGKDLVAVGCENGTVFILEISSS